MSAQEGPEHRQNTAPWTRAPATRLALSLLALGGSYFLAGKLGLLLAVGNSSVSVVWPPTGIAIAALLLGGAELWPGVFAGAFLVNLTTTWDVGSSLGIASGNTLEAVVAAFLAVRLASGRNAFTHPRRVLTFVLFSGLLASTVAATIGTTSLLLAHLASPGSFLGVWAPWWLGDAIGAIEVTPLVLAVAQRVSSPAPVLDRPGAAEALAVGTLTLLVALLVFARSPSALLGGFPLIFLVIPPVAWGAVRFGQLGATASVSTVSAVAIVATVAGDGPFATLAPGLDLLALRIFAGSVAVTALLVAAEAVRHRRLESELDHTRKELQRMLMERTAELDSAKSLAKVGTWSFDARTQKMIWSEEMYSMFGYGDDRFPVVLAHAVDRVHPDDRTAFLEEVQAGLRGPNLPREAAVPRKYRLLLPDGNVRTLLHTIHVAGVADGNVTRIAGTAQDITERQHIDDELRRLARGDPTEDSRSEGFGLWMIPSIAPAARPKRPVDTAGADR
ncbi:MAG: MASE1 domain-containing protein [Thermoplasmata archaeon]|nr:MASE1 domain-containing protein [Thermoplasmata archaeon]